MKAKYIESYWFQGHRVLEYEYRGHKYDVTDYGWKGGEPLAWQHANAQARIDAMIENEEKQKDLDPNRPTAQEAFDALWGYWETGEFD